MSATAANEWDGARVLVLGATGFMGRWTARALADAGASVWSVARDGAALDRVATRYGMTGTRVVVDLAAGAAVEHVVEAVEPDVVFNLAGYGVDRSERDEEVARRINAELPGRIARAVAGIPSRWSGSRVVHTGSALEYGESASDLAEDSEPLPTTSYGRTKLAGTLELSEAARALGLATVTGRLFMVFGAGEHDGRLLPTLLAARGGEGSVPLSPGGQQRDFAWVGDVVVKLLGLAAVEGEPGAVVNVATGVLTSVREFVERASAILEIAPRRLDFGALDVRAEEMQHQPVATARLRDLTGSAVACRIEHGVAETRDFLEGADHGRE